MWQRLVEKALCPRVRNIGRARENDVLGTFRVIGKRLLRGPKLEGLFMSYLLWQPFTIQIPESSLLYLNPRLAAELAVFPSQLVLFSLGTPWMTCSSFLLGVALRFTLSREVWVG